MRGLGSFYRLVQRPWFLIGGLFIITMCLVWVLGPILDSPSSDVDTLDLLAALWRGTLALPALFGFSVGGMLAELQSTSFAWSLPGLRRRLVAGTLQVMAVVVVLTMILHVWLGGTPSAAAGLAGLSYAIGLMVTVAAYPRALRFGAAPLIVLAGVMRPQTLAVLASAAPPVIGIGSLALGTWIVLRGLLPAVHRSQAVAQFQPEDESDGAGWRLFGTTDPPGGRGLEARDTLGWLGMIAAIHGGRGRWLASYGINAVFAAAFSYSDNSIAFLFLSFGITALNGKSPGLIGAFVYPVARRRRATLSYLANLVSGLSYALIGGLVAAALFWLRPWPQFLAYADKPLTVGIVAWIGILIAWMPVAQWAPSRPPIVDTAARLARLFPAMFVVCVLVILLAFASATLFRSQATRWGTGTMVGLFIVVIVVVQSVFYFMLQRTYAKRDLV